MKLKAFKYYFLTDKSIPGLGGAGIVVELNPELIKMQQDLIDAVAPYTVETGTAAAFATMPQEPDVNEATIGYVQRFVPEHSGKNYLPHVTVGLAPIDYLNTMLAETFDAFTFSPASASVYHLGNFGTAREQLKALDLKPWGAFEELSPWNIGLMLQRVRVSRLSRLSPNTKTQRLIAILRRASHAD